MIIVEVLGHVRLLAGGRLCSVDVIMTSSLFRENCRFFCPDRVYSGIVSVCAAEEYVNPETKIADLLYQCERSSSRSNHLANKELKLLFKV